MTGTTRAVAQAAVEPGSQKPPKPAASERPRIGFLGVGWIGRSRMEAIVDEELATVVAIADPSDEMRAAAATLAPDARLTGSFEELLEADLDGVVISTPSAMHPGQSIAALERGVAVFCQKPLGRTVEEVRSVIDAARRADRLLDVDFCYRRTAAMQRVRDVARSGEIGRIYAADLVFHNAYGPDKPWFYDPAQSGGGCVMDLGIHLVDLALWVLDFPEVERVESRLFTGGERMQSTDDRVEDYAIAHLDLASGASVRIACSWNLPAGRDAVISADFYGSEGGAAMRNINGSFYDFEAARFEGTRNHLLASGPDAWGGRAVAEWVARLTRGEGFDPAAERILTVARTIDRIYGR